MCLCFLSPLWWRKTLNLLTVFRPQALIAVKCSAKKREKERRGEQWATILKKNKSNMFETPTYRCTLNSITPPCTLHFHGCRQRICRGFFFIPSLPQPQPPPPQSPNPLPSCLVICGRHADPAFACCLLLLSPLSLVGDSTSHCDNPWIWKRPFKRNPPPLLWPPPTH